MDTTHKHRKGFREDAQILAEAYENIYNDREQLDEMVPLVAGLAHKATRGLQDWDIGDSDEELSDDWMKQDYESRQEERGGDHAKFAKIAIEALGMFKDEIHVDGHPEDINVNELTDAYNQLSRGLIGLVGEQDAIEIMGGAAQAQAEAGSEPEQFTPMEFPSDEEY